MDTVPSPGEGRSPIELGELIDPSVQGFAEPPESHVIQSLYKQARCRGKK